MAACAFPGTLSDGDQTAYSRSRHSATAGRSRRQRSVSVAGRSRQRQRAGERALAVALTCASPGSFIVSTSNLAQSATFALESGKSAPAMPPTQIGIGRLLKAVVRVVPRNEEMVEQACFS